MYKHRRSTSRKGKLRDQNAPLDASTSSFLTALTSSLEGSDPKTDYLRTEYLSKFADPSPGEALLRRSRAIEKWLGTEEHNRVTNLRLRDTDEEFNLLPRVTFRKFVKHCRKTVAMVLSELTDEVVVGGFSGGASTSRCRTRSHPGFKFSDKADVTEDAEYAVEVLLHNVPLFREYGLFSDLRVVDGAVLFTVPKNSDIDRCACKEPDVNMYLQKGVGKHIRSRLLRFGINLNDQSINRDLARLGSLSGELATLDLSSASDSISIELIRLLLPFEWFEYLNSIRSKNVVVDGDTITTEMFSSMGNGFTFELESMLFYSIVRSILYFEGISGRLSVYGDDIIFPSRGYDMVVWGLSYFGFIPNETKSFHTGFFRESCGGHYLHGSDVTPFYLKRPPARMTDLIRVANQLRRWALCSSFGLPVVVCESSVFQTWSRLRDMVPSSLWGGSDFALDTQLVTPDSPRNRLVRLSNEKEVPAKGLYMQWHNRNWNRSTPPTEESRDVSDATTFCRSRPAPNTGDVTSKTLFLEELEL